MIALKSILVPTDFGTPSETALMYGRHFARQFGAVLHVLHSVESVMLPGGAEVPMPAVQQVEKGLLDVGHRQMAAAVTDDDRVTLQVVEVVRQATSAAADILEYARAHHVDLIVMGTHGRGPIEHLLMGSVAERVVRRAPCPVLTVRSPERDFVQPDSLGPARPV